MFCTIGASGRVLRLRKDLPFVCPVCGEGLAPPDPVPRTRLAGATLFGVGIGIAVIGAFCVGVLLGVVGRWRAVPTTEILATRPITPPHGQRRYASLRSPPPTFSAGSGRRPAIRRKDVAIPAPKQHL